MRFDHSLYGRTNMPSLIQQFATGINMSFDEFVGEMRKRGCSEPTAAKIWHGFYETYDNFDDNNVYLSNLRRAADVLNVSIRLLLPE